MINIPLLPSPEIIHSVEKSGMRSRRILLALWTIGASSIACVIAWFALLSWGVIDKVFITLMASIASSIPIIVHVLNRASTKDRIEDEKYNISNVVFQKTIPYNMKRDVAREMRLKFLRDFSIEGSSKRKRPPIKKRLVVWITTSFPDATGDDLEEFFYVISINYISTNTRPEDLERWVKRMASDILNLRALIRLGDRETKNEK